MDRIEAQDSANLKLGSLACQLRVFSPKGNAFNTHHHPFFTLNQLAYLSIEVYGVGGQLIEWMASTTDIQLG